MMRAAIAAQRPFATGRSGAGRWPTGVAPHANPPVHWSETNNIRWKIPLPGKGHSTPIVFGDRIFLTAAVPVGERAEAGL